MISHEENPIRISRLRTQVAHTRDGMQWAEAYRVHWTDPASGATMVRMVGDRKSALLLKRQLKGMS
jgi:hypothetical protein